MNLLNLRRVAALIFALSFAGTVQAAPLGRATAAFENARPGRGETAWGRFVADALRARTNADIALVDAGSLNEGTLKEGDIERADIEALLSFGTRDGAVVLRVTGAQLRNALERAVQDHPTRSSSFLHASGLTATFGRTPPRVGSVRVGGAALREGDTYEVAVPSSVSSSAVFAPVWGGAARRSVTGTLADLIADYVRAEKTISPDPQARIASQ